MRLNFLSIEEIQTMASETQNVKPVKRRTGYVSEDPEWHSDHLSPASTLALESLVLHELTWPLWDEALTVCQVVDDFLHSMDQLHRERGNDLLTNHWGTNNTWWDSAFRY